MIHGSFNDLNQIEICDIIYDIITAGKRASLTDKILITIKNNDNEMFSISMIKYLLVTEWFYPWWRLAQ